MNRNIRISRLWSDNDIVELGIEVADGSSYFANRVYVGHQHLGDAIAKLEHFKLQIHGGLLDLKFGEFGCEFANGAFLARFHFPKPGRVYISCRQESEFTEFGVKKVASRASMYLVSEPALLDRFIEELRQLSSGTASEATLEAG